MNDAVWPPLGVFGALAHTVHYTLTYGGLLVLAGLLLHSRPGALRRGGERRSVPRSEHDRRVARLREAATDGRLGTMSDGGPGRTPTLTATPPPAPTPAPTPAAAAGPTAGSQAVSTWLPVAVVSSAAAAGVHAAAGPAHLQEGLLVGGFFVVSAVCQLGWSVAVLLGGAGAGLLRAALVGNAGVVLLWLLSRTIGVPGVPGPVEPVGAWDLAATGWEIAVVLVVALVLASGRFSTPAPRVLDIVRWSHAARAWLAGSVVLMLLLTATGTSA